MMTGVDNEMPTHCGRTVMGYVNVKNDRISVVPCRGKVGVHTQGGRGLIVETPVHHPILAGRIPVARLHRILREESQ